ncbi:response regulator transcription factor [Pseudobacteriovorax antillogorgiicola]|uniref:Two-component system, chemotaxis family, response regulator CheY n=1 Tax=Pseudobacteriovorax antillogorgiicola TaxID=1513793 RepID=A0A1Y6CF88_9BACT|nr:response regulator [Pseudobacteriovorax antillogorgiicola]TCS49053.1 two-component system chemotaxis response regulator CheY [Pseudobacteriovorax antillogorgiicola]SMF52488.1 two-component system, chemotaxis family, response regulator CheY [Pseudobacteriovorax antillogorgiicola]
MKVIICDDSKAVHSMITMYLDDTPYEVESVFDAVDLVVKVEQGKGDTSAIFLDWEMPKINGLETLRFLRKSGCSTPIIMLTGKNSESHIRDAMDSGAHSYVMKPFTKDLVMAALKSI